MLQNNSVALLGHRRFAGLPQVKAQASVRLPDAPVHGNATGIYGPCAQGVGAVGRWTGGKYLKGSQDILGCLGEVELS